MDVLGGAVPHADRDQVGVAHAANTPTYTCSMTSQIALYMSVYIHSLSPFCFKTVKYLALQVLVAPCFALQVVPCVSLCACVEQDWLLLELAARSSDLLGWTAGSGRTGSSTGGSAGGHQLPGEYTGSHWRPCEHVC